MVWKRLMLWGCVGFSYIVGIKEEVDWVKRMRRKWWRVGGGAGWGRLMCWSVNMRCSQEEARSLCSLIFSPATKNQDLLGAVYLNSARSRLSQSSDSLNIPCSLVPVSAFCCIPESQSLNPIKLINLLEVSRNFYPSSLFFGPHEHHY